MPTEPECICCQECGQVVNKIHEIAETDGMKIDSIKCITATQAFVSVCLNVWVLQVAWLQFRQQYGPKAFEGSENAKYRHIAFRQFVRWCCGFCGKNNRVIIPSCVVTRIRAQFPEPNDEEHLNYRGFRLPREQN